MNRAGTGTVRSKQSPKLTRESSPGSPPPSLSFLSRFCGHPSFPPLSSWLSLLLLFLIRFPARKPHCFSLHLLCLLNPFPTALFCRPLAGFSLVAEFQGSDCVLPPTSTLGTREPCSLHFHPSLFSFVSDLPPPPRPSPAGPFSFPPQMLLLHRTPALRLLRPPTPQGRSTLAPHPPPELGVSFCVLFLFIYFFIVLHVLTCGTHTGRKGLGAI